MIVEHHLVRRWLDDQITGGLIWRQKPWGHQAHCEVNRAATYDVALAGDELSFNLPEIEALSVFPMHDPQFFKKVTAFLKLCNVTRCECWECKAG